MVLVYKELLDRSGGLGQPTFVAAYLLAVILAASILYKQKNLIAITMVIGVVVLLDLIGVAVVIATKIGDGDPETVWVENNNIMLVPIYAAVVLSRISILFNSVKGMRNIKS